MKRNLDDWLSSYLKYVNDTEQPKQFKIWSAVSCIAGALQRRVYWPWGSGRIFPHLYIVLVGKSGLGKGEAMKPAINIFKELEFPIVAEATTREDLIQFMAKDAQATYRCNHTNTDVVQSAVQIFSKELIVLLGEKNFPMLSNMTDWYDADDLWSYKTKTAGKFAISGVCPNMLAATAPDWIDAMIPVEAHGGGFASRVLFVVATKKDKLIPFPIYNDWHLERRKDLIHDLKIISTLSGPIEADPTAMELFRDFYMEQEEALLKGDLPEHITDPGLEGYVTRRPMQLCKLAMIMSVSRSNSLVIKTQDIEKAKVLLTEAEKDMSKVFMGLGKADGSKAIYSITQYLIEKGPTTRQVLLRALHREFDFEAIDKAISFLEQMGAIKTKTDGKGTTYSTIK